MNGWYTWGYGPEYKSPVTIGSLPLVHIASGFDPMTMAPRVARGVIAIGGVAAGLISSFGALTK